MRIVSKKAAMCERAHCSASILLIFALCFDPRTVYSSRHFALLLQRSLLPIGFLNLRSS